MNLIASKIESYIRSISDLSASDALDRDTQILTLGYVDSFSVLGILNFIEEEFAVKVDEKFVTLDYFDSINRIAGLVGQLGARGTANG